MRLALTILLMALFSQNASSKPIIVAHRGASADAPENTLAAFQLAWEQGADAIEGDFHLTKDNQVACIHDKHTGRIASSKLSIRRNTYSNLQSLDIGSWKSPAFSKERIPPLSSILEILPDNKQLFIELKSSSKIVEPLLETLDQAGTQLEQIVIITFDRETIRELKRRRPTLSVNLLSNIRRRTKGGPLLPTADRILAKLRECGADGLGIYAHPDLEQPFAETIIEAGYPVHVWTVDNPDLAKKWATWGASSITTNTPAKIRESLE